MVEPGNAIPCDCLIVGGGPAGAVLACLLGRAGVHTVLVDDGRPRHSGPYESLLPGAMAMLARTGCLDLVQPAAEADVLRHGAIWGGDALRWQEAGAPGLWLRRGAFDEALRRQAVSLGVTVHCPARACGDLGKARLGIVLPEHGGSAIAYRPKLVVAATGRRTAAVVADAHTVRTGPPTLALTLVGDLPPAARGVAIVEAAAEGWTWLQAPIDGPASVAVMLDAPAATTEGKIVARVRRLLAACRGPAAALASAPVRHAVLATARCLATDAEILLVGDAAATIDPLASQGVEKALAAADHAAAIVRAMLRRESLVPLLRDEHRRWEHGLWTAHQARSAAFHAAETRFPDAPYWRRRAATPAPPSPPAPADAVFAVAVGVRMVPTLRRIGDDFEACDGAELGDTRLSHLGFVPVRPLLQAFAPPTTLVLAERIAARDPRCFVLPPFAVRQALRELLVRGWLVRVGGAADTR